MRLLPLLLLFATPLCAQVDPNTVIGIECKTGQEDIGVPIFEDMLFGVDAAEFTGFCRSLGVNVLRVPLVKAVYEQKRAALVVDFVKKVRDNGGGDMRILLNQRKWNLQYERIQQAWAEHIAYTYNALKEAGLDDMVVGCVFDENAPLKGAQSDEALWDEYHRAILGAMDKLNALTGNAFKTRTVFIHGKGYGSQFRGVEVSSTTVKFPEQMRRRCTGYCYNFKYFETGMPEDKSLAGWERHFREYCAFGEVYRLGVPMIFVGDPGDGLRAGSFTPGKAPYPLAGEYVIPALRNVFKGYGWSGFSFGTCFRDTAAQSPALTILNDIRDGHIAPRKAIVDEWLTWRDTTRP